MKILFGKRIWFQFIAWSLIVASINCIGCSPRKETLDGLWQIERYQDHGKDQMQFLTDLNFGNEMSITFPDPSDESGSWGITAYKSDTAYVILGSLNYDKPVLNFLNTYAYITVLGPGRGQFIAHTSTDPAYRDQVPLYLFEGEWKVIKEGRNTLELTRTGTNKIYMKLRRKN